MSFSDQKLTELLSDESFVRWINDQASQPEQERWDEWEQEDPAHRELKNKARMMYQLPLEMDEGDDVKMQLDRLNAKIDRPDSKGDRFPRKQIQGKRKRNGYYVAVAAVITLLLSVVGVFSMYYPSHAPDEEKAPLFTTIEVGYGETGSLKISDGSQIRLNAKSSLRYSPEQFNTAKVEVWLQGEAYFNITHNPGGRRRTFIVHTPDGDVQVLGTKFNVNTRFHETSVVLEEGSVKVSLTDSLQHETVEKIMEPGDRAVLGHDIVLQKVDVNLYTAWLEGKMVFMGTTLEKIIETIESTYGITLDVESTALLKEKITGSIQNPDLATLLRGLEQVLNLKIEKSTEDEFLITKQSIHKH